MDVAFVRADGYTCGMMDRDFFNVFHLEMGKEYNCIIERTSRRGGAIWVPYLEM